MKSSKYIQTNLTTAESDYLGYNQVAASTFPSTGRETITLQRQTSLRKQNYNVKSSEEMLLSDSTDSRQHFSATDLHRGLKLSHEQEIELLCRNGQFFTEPPHYIRAEYGLNRSCCSTPRGEVEGRKVLQCGNGGGTGFERRGFVDPGKQQAAVVAGRGCDPAAISGTKFQRNASLRRMQHTPEIINTHLGHNALLYDSYRDENCSLSATTDFDKDLLGNDEYGFRRGVGGLPGIKATSRTTDTTRTNGNNSERRKRKQGDGMDAVEADCDPEQIFELMGSQRAPTCHCSCDHVYNPGYMCLQIIGPISSDVIDMSRCSNLGNHPQELLSNFGISFPGLLSDSDIDPVQIINGNISLTFPVDTIHRIFPRTMRLKKEKWIPDKNYLNNEFLSTIIEQLNKDVTPNVNSINYAKIMYHFTWKYYEYEIGFC